MVRGYKRVSMAEYELAFRRDNNTTGTRETKPTAGYKKLVVNRLATTTLLYCCKDGG